MTVGGRELLPAGGDGRSNGVGIVISEEISNEVVRVERWKRANYNGMGYDQKTSGAKIIKKNTKLDSKQTSNVPC